MLLFVRTRWPLALASLVGMLACTASETAPVVASVETEPSVQPSGPPASAADEPPAIDTRSCVYTDLRGIVAALPNATIWQDGNHLFADRNDEEWRHLVFRDGCWKRLAYPASLDPRVDDQVPPIRRIGGTPEAPVFLFQDGTIVRGVGSDAKRLVRDALPPGSLLESWVDPEGGFIAYVVGKSGNALLSSRGGGWSEIDLPVGIEDPRNVVFLDPSRMAVSDREGFGIYSFVSKTWRKPPLDDARFGARPLARQGDILYMASVGGVHALADGQWTKLSRGEDVLFDTALSIDGSVWVSGISPAKTVDRGDRVFFELVDGRPLERQRFDAPEATRPVIDVHTVGDVAFMVAAEHTWFFSDGAWSSIVHGKGTATPAGPG